MPQRIQRKRTKGWHMPEGAAYVGRGTTWGNPFRVGGGYVILERVPLPTIWHPERAEIRDVETAIALYRRHIAPRTEAVRAMLAGRDLACWCPLDQPCHADVLLEIANGGQ